MSRGVRVVIAGLTSVWLVLDAVDTIRFSTLENLIGSNKNYSIEYIRGLPDIWPEHPRKYLHMAMVAEKQGDKESSLNYLEKYITLDPGSFVAMKVKRKYGFPRSR